MALASVVGATLLINLPFGWFREGTRKFSPAWFPAVHAAVPLGSDETPPADPRRGR